MVRFRLTNQAQSVTVADLECSADFNHGGANDFDGVGFTWDNAGIYYTCLCRSYPLVRNVSTYWIGDTGERTNNYWVQSDVSSVSSSGPGCAFSWKGLAIPAGESTTVGVVFQTAVFRGKPVLTLSYESDGMVLDGSAVFSCSLYVLDVIDPLIPLRVSGTINNAAECNLYVVIDSDLSNIVLLEVGLGELLRVGFGVGYGSEMRPFVWSTAQKRSR
jgi:hypothetical protein